MTSEHTGYRFQDAQEDVTSDASDLALHAVEFYPSIDDYVAVAEFQNKKHNALTSVSKLALQGFLFVNWLALPAVLFFFGYAMASLFFLALNLVFALLFLPAMMRFDYRRYYRQVYGENFENELIRVELSQTGISIRHLNSLAFYGWDNVTGVEERSESIFIHLRASTLPIRKSGFAYVEMEQNFLAFLREHDPSANRNQLSQ